MLLSQNILLTLFNIPGNIFENLLIMVQILPLFLATLAIISPVVQACTPGLDYCGYTLLEYGEGQSLRDLKADASGSVTNILPILGWHGIYPTGLYHCDHSGSVRMIKHCTYGGCRDRGTGNSDFCPYD